MDLTIAHANKCCPVARCTLEPPTSTGGTWEAVILSAPTLKREAPEVFPIAVFNLRNSLVIIHCGALTDGIAR